jgi:outer membrane protein OmpA-like peptidoglycan-associated protein
MERTATPPKIRMYMRSEHPEYIQKWHAEAMENGKVIAHTEGTGSIPQTFDWILSNLADTLIHGEEPVHFSLTVIDSAGNEGRTDAQIQLKALTLRKKRELRIADKRIDKFSLFLFEFDKSDLSKRSDLILRSIEKAIHPNSDVTVIGFTDRTGEAEHNKALSEDRARAVADHIDINAHPAHIHSEGRGDTELLFDNSLPEGRYFCRTVYVRVETPVNE